jgi:uncharacterized protein (TIGR03435 family)
MRIKRSMALGCLSAWLACEAFAQSTKTPEFEVADVRINKLDLAPTAEFLPSGQVTLRGITMKALIGIGWKETHMFPELTALSVAVSPAVAQFKVLLADYLKGGPSWLDSDRFDVLAKAPAGTPVQTMRLMLQKLLADRFHLMVHREEKVLKVYSMAIAKGGAKLNQAKGGDPVCVPSIGQDNVYHRECHNMTMAELAEQLPSYAPRFFEGRPVVNATDLQGAWDFRLDWTPLSGGLAGLEAAPGAEFDSGTTIFRTMEKNLGLKLEQREQAMTIVVIDQVDRVPTDN